MSLGNVLYLTWGEVIVKSGVFKNQVVRQVVRLKKKDERLNIFLLSGIPLLNLKLVSSPKKFFQELTTHKNDLAQNGIDFQYRFLHTLSIWFYSKKGYNNLYYFLQKKFLADFIKRNNISVIHCRSYHAALFAIKVREKYNMEVKIIFDTRGNFPEEGVVKKKYTFESKHYQNWKQLEQELVAKCDKVVNVSDTFSDYFQRSLSGISGRKMETIYTSVDQTVFYRRAEPKSQFKEQLGISNQSKVLLYLGDIRPNAWHTLGRLTALFKGFRETFPGALLLVVTLHEIEELKNSLKTEGLSDGEFLVLPGATPAKTAALINAADYGALPFRDMNNKVDEIFGYTMIASKTGEYLATGLPLIVNKYVGAAAKMTREQSIGVVYAPEEEMAIKDSLLAVDANYALTSDKCVQLSKELFNAEVNAQRYLDIYAELSS